MMDLSRRQFNKLIGGALLGIGVSLSVASCGPQNTSSPVAEESKVVQEEVVTKTKLRLAQNLSPISGVTIVAKEKGFFDQQGLEVEILTFTSGKKCLETVLGGAADIRGGRLSRELQSRERLWRIIWY